MAELGDVRQRDDGTYEILTTIDSETGEDWEPYATSYVNSALLPAPQGEFFDVSIADALRAEGWVPR